MNPYISKTVTLNGKRRKITMYADNEHGRNKRIKDEELLGVFRRVYEPSKFVYAYTSGKGIKDNATLHMYSDEFIFLDIKNFFPSINHEILACELTYVLVEYMKKHKDNRVINLKEIPFLINFCTTKKDKGLQLGLVCSPILSNIYLNRFDHGVYAKIQKKKKMLSETDKSIEVLYSRYADDIVISFKKEDDSCIDDSEISKFKNEIIAIVENELKNFELILNWKKTKKRSIDVNNHVVVTGVNIVYKNGERSLTVGKKYKNCLFWECVKFYQEYLNINSTKSEDILKERDVLFGKHNFILSIEPNYYEEAYSPNMKGIIANFGFESLEELLKQCFTL